MYLVKLDPQEKFNVLHLSANFKMENILWLTELFQKLN